MKCENNHKLERRDFLRSLAFLGGSVVLAGCIKGEKPVVGASAAARKSFASRALPLYAFGFDGSAAQAAAELENAGVEFPVLVQFDETNAGEAVEFAKLIGRDSLCMACVVPCGSSLPAGMDWDVVFYDLRGGDDFDFDENVAPVTGCVVSDDVALVQKLLAEHSGVSCLEISASSRTWNDDSAFAALLKRCVTERDMGVFVADSLPSYCRTRPSLASLDARYAAALPGVVSVVLPMSQPDLPALIREMSDFEPLTSAQQEFLEDTARNILENKAIPCTECGHCMPCPYGLDIPAIFLHYNKCVELGRVPVNPVTEDYVRARRAYLLSMDVGVPRLRRADRCVTCGACLSHCPQHINIPEEMCAITRYTALLEEN